MLSRFHTFAVWQNIFGSFKGAALDYSISYSPVAAINISGSFLASLVLTFSLLHVVAPLAPKVVQVICCPAPFGISIMIKRKGSLFKSVSKAFTATLLSTPMMIPLLST